MNTEKLKKYVLPNLPYLLVFWFFDKLGWAYRLAPGVDFVRKLTGSVTTINAAFANPLPSLVPFDLFVGIAGAAAIYAVVYFKGKNARKYRKGVEYGSARSLAADANGGLKGGPHRRVSPRGLGGSATNKPGCARTSPCLLARMLNIPGYDIRPGLEKGLNPTG